MKKILIYFFIAPMILSVAACGGGGGAGAGAGNASVQSTDGTAAISAVILTVN